MEDLSFLVKQTFKDQSQDWMEEDEEGWEPEVELPLVPAKPRTLFSCGSSRWNFCYS